MIDISKMTSTRALTTAEKKAQQDAGRKFQCYADCDATSEPPADDCVLDYGDAGGCMHAARRRTRETCRYWQPARQGDMPL